MKKLTIEIKVRQTESDEIQSHEKTVFSHHQPIKSGLGEAIPKIINFVMELNQ